MSPYNQRRHSSRYGRATLAKSPRYNSRQPKKAYIHPSRFVKSAEAIAATPYAPVNRFSDFDLHTLIQDNLTLMGFSEPSPIQDQAIPAGLLGRDVVGIANTGTGKTVAFAVPLLNRLMSDRNSQALIMAPTRELAQQIEGQCRQVARGSGLNGALLIGGVPMGPQLQQLKQNPRIIIGTPGRIKDHLERRSLDLARCNIVVLDEFDRMLDMGFINDIRHILDRTNQTRQGFYFSATLDDRVKGIVEAFSRDPVQISVKSGETAANVEQNVVTFGAGGDRLDKLHELLNQGEVIKALVFDDTHRSVEKLSKQLQDRGFSSDFMHGGKSQSQRQRVLKKFKDGHVKVLVATDVAARGLDVSDITHVINYSLPQSYDDYIHRIGRAGRAGRTGYALTFVGQ